ncbi:Tfp pilus assembly protein PilO [Microbacterium trichothecenolyticum]|uniref:hypothetical protein n=1 Tax=Microbacterium trichothecenolyticum TaxID=69370 RepID=UPI002862A7E3|nr:hypothetical protein [Microbacterium trichothecenolyticum]MDR7185780.1 Tfp pilus assembly protein PilO [Microbacterium trichothecenolyticum]
MPKHIVTAIGLIVSLGVIALGVFLVAMPLYFQAVAVDGQTATVASTNALYQSQVDELTVQQENLDQINADVADLRAQIPSSGQLDDVFEVVGHAAEASGVQIGSVTAGAQVAYATRSGAIEGDAAAAVPAPAPEATDAATDTTTGTATDAAPAPDLAAGAGRQQVDFTIAATATDMEQATAFVDALRAGPRLLNSMAVTMTQSGEGTVDITVTALTYVDGEE